MSQIGAGNPTRAQLKGKDDGDSLNCQFNPETLTRGKTAKWTPHPTTKAGHAPTQQFVGTGPETLSVKLLFDRVDTLGAQDGKTVDQIIDKVFSWLLPSDKSQTFDQPSPTVVDFVWGSGFTFSGIISEANVEYLMFDSAGKTLRANITLSMQSAPDSVQATNPTSGGISGRTSVQVADGDTLASISYAQYGDPNLWRAIAEANGVDDPARVPPGTHLIVPPRGEAAAIAAPRPAGAS